MISATICLAGYLISLAVCVKLANRPSEPGSYKYHDNSDLIALLELAKKTPRKWFYFN